MPYDCGRTRRPGIVKDMTTTPSTPPTVPTSADRVRRIFDGYTGLYAPSVIAEAAAYLDDLFATAARHGHTNPRSDANGWLVQAAAEATSSKYGRPQMDRTGIATAQALADLTTAFQDRGLTVVACQAWVGVAVAPLPEGPVWGYGSAGLAVCLYVDSGWTLSVNRPQSRIHTIYAPVTKEGAAEVADLVHGVLAGSVPDPFRAR